MIAGIFHKGSGLGNQLFRYITTRTLALDKGYEFGMVAPELFKGSSFMNLDMGAPFTGTFSIENSSGKVTPIPPGHDPLVHETRMHPSNSWEENMVTYNPEINYIEDNTIIDGNLEDPRYWEHRMSEINSWLRVEPLRPVELHSRFCAIGFRGGEYKTVPELFLPKSYWDEAIALMKKGRPGMTFEVHTDDFDTAKEFFPDIPVYTGIDLNWRVMRYAPYAIIANSSFYVMPRLLRHHDHINSLTIAPKYWNRYNTKKYEYPQNYYKQFFQI